MHNKPQYSVTLLPGNEVRFLSLSRTAKVKPDYRPMGAERYHSQAAAMFAVAHYKETGRILLHEEVKTTLRKRKQNCAGAREKKKSPKVASGYRRNAAGEQGEMRL
jgi:hypothetical protein